MTFDARKVIPSARPFPFVGLDGETYKLPNINTLTGEQSRRLKGGDESVLAEIADPDAYEAIEAMPLGVQAQLAHAWIEHGGQPGKAGSPSSRTRRSGKRSR
ncbi:hypothetical protein [Streptomyces thermolilacinus]|uniref:hypothetical protein n=1 Tax=Streptomyces thermolilacinus TaxID=285540 RepID=UPI0033E3DF9A